MICSLLSLAGLSAPAAPPQELQRLVDLFPMEVVGQDLDAQEISMAPDMERILALTRYDAVTLTDLALPTGVHVDLQLERIDLARLGLGFYVDGEARADLLDNLDLSVWKGTVVGDADSDVRVSFSNHGTRGWIRHGDDLVHLMPSANGDGSWYGSGLIATTENSLRQRGKTLDQFCGVELDASEPGFDPRWISTTGSGASTALGNQPCDARECTIAIETDFQLFQLFNDLAAETAYITTLLAFVGDRFESQVNTVLTYPYVMFYTNANDPWNTPDSGGTASTMIAEFRAAWVGHIPMDATLGHFVSGASMGGGYAYINVLGAAGGGFAVSGNLSAQVSFPVVPQPTNWDFIVISHELGHNFSAPHTHDLCPPIDECASPGYAGICQYQTICRTDGTLMSYCYLCIGGTTNITTFFHPEIAARMQTAAELSLPLLHGSARGQDLAVISQSASTPITAQVSGNTDITGIDLMFRYNAASYIRRAMTDEGGGLFSAELPPAICSAKPEYYFSFSNPGCGADTDPPNAPLNTYKTAVGIGTLLFSDNFESNKGWTAVNQGASEGEWRRRRPSDDATSTYDPASDHDGSGKCYVTGAGPGGVDVDGGAVSLVSPVLDTSAGSVSVQYAYYLGLSDADGTDALRVEWSSNGLDGPWIEIRRHDTHSSDWRTQVVTPTELMALGVSYSADTRVRFVVNDSGAASTVEAGLDAFKLLAIDCFGGASAPYCVTSPNSATSGAVILSFGSLSLIANNLTLAVGAGVPSSPGLFFYGSAQVQTPFGDGIRCVGGATQRLYPVQAADASGTTVRQLDFTAPPVSAGPRMITAGSTWNFQYWLRDGAAGKTGFNMSNGLSLTFAP